VAPTRTRPTRTPATHESPVRSVPTTHFSVTRPPLPVVEPVQPRQHEREQPDEPQESFDHDTPPFWSRWAPDGVGRAQAGTQTDGQPSPQDDPNRRPPTPVPRLPPPGGEPRQLRVGLDRVGPRVPRGPPHRGSRVGLRHTLAPEAHPVGAPLQGQHPSPPRPDSPPRRTPRPGVPPPHRLAVRVEDLGTGTHPNQAPTPGTHHIFHDPPPNPGPTGPEPNHRPGDRTFFPPPRPGPAPDSLSLQ
jgi:hypothetical protein